MSLKFELQGSVGGWIGNCEGRLDGIVPADLLAHRRGAGPGDPAPPEGEHPLDDPDPGAATAGDRLGDPEEPYGAHELDDPGDPGPPPPGGSGGAPGAAPYSGFIVVRISSLVPPDEAAGSLEELAQRNGLIALGTLLERFGGPPSRPAITAPHPDPDPIGPPPVPSTVFLEDLEARAATSAFPPRHGLRSYWLLDARALQALSPAGEPVAPRGGLSYPADRVARTLVRDLNALSEVDLAYRELAAMDPSGPSRRGPAAEELSDFQLSLGPAPLGLGADWARGQLGAGNLPLAPHRLIPLGDLEQGWDRRHPDLEVPAPIHGSNRRGVGTYRGDHGTAVLGQLVGKGGNEVGVVGIAEGVAKIALASHYRVSEASPAGEGPAAGAKGRRRDSGAASNGAVADAIVALMTRGGLGPGAVLLLEVERAGRPVELHDLDFDAIRLATANGVTVVEAAGNGGLDLDRLPAARGRCLDRRSPRFRDSGAIVVGAARPALPHDRAAFSNYGARVDCFAWGGGVTTAGYGDLLEARDHQRYTERFSGTSSAAAMIAGAASLVQALYQEHAGPLSSAAPEDAPERWNRLSPQQLRSLLSHPRACTRQGPNVPGAIGVMPDLRKVVEDVLGIAPKVYLRDHPGDDGWTCRRRGRCSSPDIVVSKEAAAGGSTGRKVEVRVRNRGLREARNTSATLYCAPLLSLVTPDRWGEPLAGAKSSGATVPQGDTPTAIGRPDWLLPPGEHCLVATVEHDGGAEAPRPCHPSAFDWRRFLRMLREGEAVALNNVHSLLAQDKARFALTGTPDAPRVFAFEVLQCLPRDVSLLLTAPLGIAAKWSRQRLWKVQRSRQDPDAAALHLPKQPRLPLGSLMLPPAIDFPCSFTLLGDGSSVEESHGVALRQLFEGEEVGRITWRFLR